MNTTLDTRRNSAMTMIEVLAAIVALGFLAGFLLPRITGCHKVSGSRIACVHNLKQVSLAFRMFANDHDARYPWQAPVATGGTLELAAWGKAFPHLLAISNEIVSPKMLTCPEDGDRTRAVSFADLFAGRHISYFIGLDAEETMPGTWLSGDRSLSTNGRFVSGFLTVRSNSAVGWAKGMHEHGGNLAFADGSVQQLSSGQLQRAAGCDTNLPARLILP